MSLLLSPVRPENIVPSFRKMPIKAPRCLAMRSPRLNREAAASLRMGRRVLVVDDDPLVLEVTVSMPEELGCDVLQAHSGIDAS